MLSTEEITPNNAVMLVALIQVHVVMEAPSKEKSRLHGQVAAVIPAESVAESKSICTL